MMSKILHRFYDLYSGGAEVVVLNIVRALQTHEHVLAFDNYRPTWLSTELKRLRYVSLIRVENQGFAGILAKESPDIILFHYYPPMSASDLSDLPPLMAARAAVYNHWYDPVPYEPEISRYCFPSASSHRLSGEAIPERCKTVIINPVSERFFDVRRHGDSTFRVGRHSRGTPGKFPPEFFPMFEQMEVSGLQVLALGHPPAMAEWLSSRAFALKHDYWLLTANTVDVARFLSWIDVYVYKTHPRFRETCPLCILEALAAGIPVVGEERGGIADLVVHGQTGFLCRTLDDYRRGVQTLYSDPALRRRFGTAARQWARDHASLTCFAGQISRWLNLATH